MKIYSDTLTPRDLYDALPPGVDVNYDAPVSARLRARRFNHVRLSTEHGNRWPNGGQYGGAGPLMSPAKSLAHAPPRMTNTASGWPRCMSATLT
jgi:hypothetical protein